MDNSIDVVVEEPLWQSIDLNMIATKSFAAISAGLPLYGGPYELSILACNDARIAELNGEFRAKPAPTNVLSWPGFDLAAKTDGGTPDAPPSTGVGDPSVNIGDIALSYETCLQEARDAAIDLQHHITHLLIHGILHLLGYDHETDADADVMESLEIKLLATMAIGNPYKNV
jgi:probable rRNA maturation factor